MQWQWQSAAVAVVGGRAIHNLNRCFIKEGNEKKEIQSERNYKIKEAQLTH